MSWPSWERRGRFNASNDSSKGFLTLREQEHLRNDERKSCGQNRRFAPNYKTCGKRASSPSLFLNETRNSNRGRTAILSKPLHTIFDFSARSTTTTTINTYSVLRKRSWN